MRVAKAVIDIRGSRRFKDTLSEKVDILLNTWTSILQVLTPKLLVNSLEKRLIKLVTDINLESLLKLQKTT